MSTVRRGLAVVALASLLSVSAACQSSDISNAELLQAIQQLRAEVASLQAQVSRLETELKELREAPVTTDLPAASPLPPGGRAASPPAQADSTQCAAVTQRGSRCSRRAQAGGRYCWQHARMHGK